MRAQPLLLPTENTRSQGVSLRLSLPPPHFGIFAPANDRSLTELTALMGKAPSIQTRNRLFCSAPSDVFRCVLASKFLTNCFPQIIFD